jgi:chromosome segregation ATPase
LVIGVAPAEDEVLMRRLWFCLIRSSFVVMSGLLSASAEEPVQPPVLRLPGLLRDWSPAGQAAKRPEITIEEVSRCIGSDMNLQTRESQLLRRQAELQAEAATLEKRSKDLRQAHVLVTEEGAALDAMVEAFRREESEMAKRRAQIERDASAKAIPAADMKKLKARIDQFNATVAARKVRLDELRAMETAINQKRHEFNLAAHAANESITEFMQRSDAFVQQATRFDQDVERFKSGCTGTRTLTK